MKTSNHLLRRLTAALLAAVLALSIALPVFASDDGDTIYINSVSDLLSLAKSCAYDQWSVGKTVILQKDLSLEGMLWEPIPSFSGQFKGNGHTISDLTITGQYSPAGLFGIVEEQGSIESLSVRGIVSVSDSADTTTGGIVGINHGTLINSYHVHVSEHIDAFTKLKFESEFQKLSPGGAISYVEVPNMQDNLEAVMSVLQFIYDNIMYAELNTKSDYCQCCGYDGEIKIVEDDGKLVWECPKCGNRDQNKLNVARRTCGYIGTQFWNQGRTQEIKDRVLHL